MFKKIKSLFAKSVEIPSSVDKQKEVGEAVPKSEPVSTQSNNTSSHPITSEIMAWLDKQEWKYDHRTPSEGYTHHIIMGFTDREHEWTCVFRINEDNQLVTAFGILEDSVPVSHYTAMLMELAKLNLNVNFGSVEFDPMDGEIRAKVAFDVEFTPVTDKMLGCYLQALAGLTEVARSIMILVMLDDEPSQFAGDYIDLGDEVKAVIDDEKRIFFLPTQLPQ